VGNIHFKDGERYLEQAAAAIILTGGARPYYFEDGEREVDFFDLKGDVEDALDALGVSGTLFSPSHLHSFHPGQQARMLKGSSMLGSLGQVHPKHLTPLGIEQPVFFAEFSLSALMEVRPESIEVSPPPIFPGSQRDWTVTLENSAPVGALLKAAKELESPLVENVRLRALYQSKKLGSDRKNVTLRFFYRNREKTVSFEEVEAEHKRITLEVAKKLGDRVVLS